MLVDRSSRATERPVAAAANPVSRPLVLIVDDDVELRETLKDLFGSVDIDTETFATTRELLNAGLPDRPSCLVLDLRLPGASGLELQKQLTEMGAQLPIVFITGHADVSTSVRAMKAGAVDFLPKPFRDQELLDVVSAALVADEQRRAKDEDLSELRTLAKQLTPREIDVLRGVSRGLLNKQVAYEIGVSEITVKMHRSSAGRKLKVKSVVDMLRKIELLEL